MSAGLDVNARATEAGAVLEWQALPESMREALRGARKCHGGRTIHGHGTSGGPVAGLRARRLLDIGFGVKPRGCYVREVGMAWEAAQAGAAKRVELGLR